MAWTGSPLTLLQDTLLKMRVSTDKCWEKVLLLLTGSTCVLYGPTGNRARREVMGRLTVVLIGSILNITWQNMGQGGGSNHSHDINRSNDINCRIHTNGSNDINHRNDINTSDDINRSNYINSSNNINRSNDINRRKYITGSDDINRRNDINTSDDKYKMQSHAAQHPMHTLCTD